MPEKKSEDERRKSGQQPGAEKPGAEKPGAEKPGAGQPGDEASEPGQEPSFEASLASLEQIVHDLEEGKLGLNEALGRYEEGVRLLRRCYGLLERAERRIELLSGIDAEGNPITQPFADPAAGSLEKKGEGRSRRRTAPPEENAER